MCFKKIRSFSLETPCCQWQKTVDFCDFQTRRSALFPEIYYFFSVCHWWWIFKDKKWLECSMMGFCMNTYVAWQKKTCWASWNIFICLVCAPVCMKTLKSWPKQRFFVINWRLLPPWKILWHSHYFFTLLQCVWLWHKNINITDSSTATQTKNKVEKM